MSDLDDLYEHILIRRITRTVGLAILLGGGWLIFAGFTDGVLGGIVFGILAGLYGGITTIWPRRGAGFLWFLVGIV